MAQPRFIKPVEEKVISLLRLKTFILPERPGFYGNGAPGRMLEHLFGVEENNNDAADFNSWEIKFHGSKSLLTLFHKDPEPSGILNDYVLRHGWKDRHNRVSFRHTISGASKRGFMIGLEPDKLFLKNGEEDSYPVWYKTTLNSSATSKLRRLLVVGGNYASATRLMTLNNANLFWDFDFDKFYESVLSGVVKIDFDARTNSETDSGIRNHGTKFRINRRDLASLYRHNKEILLP